MATVSQPSSRRKASKRPPPPTTEAPAVAASNGPPRLAEPNDRQSSAKKAKIIEPDVESKTESIPVKLEQQSPPTAPAPVTVPDWSTEDLTELVTRLENLLPKNDNAKYSTLVEKLDWDKITFGRYSSTECKAKWHMIMTRLRRYRTLTDMVTDAREWLKHPWVSYNGSKKQQKHPEMPKKPLTPYFRYFSEKREKYGKAHPKMTMTDLAKFLSKKYQLLSEKKKQKYKDGYERENEIYKQDFERFKKEHPESQVAGSGRSNSSNNHDSAGPSKPMNPFQFFSADRLKRPDYLQLDKKEASERARKQWNVLSDGKRIKWIRKALQDEHRFELELAEYATTHPDFKVETLKTVLSKAEKELKDKYDGKPERPPNSGYSLFSRIKLRELKDIPAKEKMAEISRRWKDLSEIDRNAFNKQAQKANQRYKEKYAIYLSSLNEEGRQKLLTEAANGKAQKKFKAAPAAVESAVPQLTNGTTKLKEEEPAAVKTEPGNSQASNLSALKKPASAMFFFQQEKLLSSQQKHPGFSKQELLRLISREFTELPEKKKEKYRRLAEESKKQEVKKNATKCEEVSETQGKKKLFKGEPRKPPQSGYGVFSTEMLSVLTDIDPKQRMAEIAKRWKAMAPSDQQKYKIRSQELSRKYKKEFAKFLNALPEEDLKEYYRMKKAAKKPAVPTAKTPAKAPVVPSEKTKPTKPKPDTESSEEGEEASGLGDEEDSSAEEGSDQSDNEESGSGSGSDDSGSDSDEDSDDEEDKSKKEKANESSSDDSGSESESGSSDESSDSGSDSDEEE